MGEDFFKEVAFEQRLRWSEGWASQRPGRIIQVEKTAWGVGGMQQRLKCVWDRWMNEIYSCPPIHKTLHLLFLLSEMSSFLSAYPMPNIPPSSPLKPGFLEPLAWVHSTVPTGWGTWGRCGSLPDWSLRSRYAVRSLPGGLSRGGHSNLETTTSPQVWTERQLLFLDNAIIVLDQAPFSFSP